MMEAGGNMHMAPGRTDPLGAHWDGGGVNFALAAPSAKAVTLCLFDDSGKNEQIRLAMVSSGSGIWTGYLPGARPGLVYGYRVSGEHNPRAGLRFCDKKVLLDPYARQIVGRYEGQPSFVDSSDTDTAGIALKGRVINDAYDWEGDRHPNVPLSATVLYEMHVKGFTKCHPDVPENLRGTYAGLACPAVLDYLQDLGITAVELLPVFALADEGRLIHMGAVNYWGYNPIGYFAPENRYWSGRPGTSPVSEFRDMVKALHSRGIEVILDVVYNHTAEGNELGPALSFRGIDNDMYYWLRQDNAEWYENWSGCGNSLKTGHPQVRKLVLDSLRYWTEEMHVDGFRFDLAPSLARDDRNYSVNSAFFREIAEDPVLSHVKLIAEPWDLGPDGYQTGNFPFGWQEWNDRFRDTMRSFWMHRGTSLADFAERFTGSHDLFGKSHRLPTAGINFITAHDGFTLRDLVSYNGKHNEANGENNRDGTDHNLSWNCGEEGESSLSEVLRRRRYLQRALMATLILSQGIPMITAGDELGRTQKGNNNPYCQDNDLTWFDWENTDAEMHDFTRRLLAFRRRYLAAGQKKWFSTDHTDYTAPGIGIHWLSPTGHRELGSRWTNMRLFCMGIVVRAETLPRACLILVNAGMHPVVFRLPPGQWELYADSSAQYREGANLEFQAIIPDLTVMVALQ